MAQYIDKDALIAEIERRKEINKYRDTPDSLFEDEGILSFITSLEVKEVDFGVEISKELSRVWYGEYLDLEKFEKSAKHFFELGLKTQKGK
jgi:hypothetical protein